MISKKYQFSFSRKAERDFEVLPKSLQKQIFKKLAMIEEYQNPFEFAMKLQGVKNTYRIRHGEYRIVFRPEPDGSLVVLVILKIGHRRNVYE